MDVRSHQRQQQIQNNNFEKNVSGFNMSKKRHENYSAASSPTLSRAAARPHTSHNTKFEATKLHPMSGRLRPQKNYYRDSDRAKELNESQEGQYQQQASGEQYRQYRKQQLRHLQFVKSYHQWLKQTQIDEYQSSRMINSFALKKTRASLRPKKEAQIYEFKVYQPHFNHEYHPPKLFPSRTHQSLKKVQPKSYNSTRNHQRPRHKNEGELKLQIMKSVAKQQASTKQQKPRKTCKIRNNDQSDNSLSLFMKTFSNPKLLSIKNGGQLVTGTKIVFIN